MQILGLEAVGVAQMHHASGAAAHARRHDDAVGDRHDRRAGRRAVVDAEMRAHLAQDRMQAARENPDVTTGWNFSGDARKNRRIDTPCSS